MTVRSRVLLGCAALLAATAHAAPPRAPAGTWANPAKSVHVAFKPCGRGICGTVVWASPQAEADAQRGGGGRLTGTMLFRDFQPVDATHWEGTVFVPDIGAQLTGTIEQINARTLKGEGCVFAGFGCKTQVWTRIK
jgi:uncharacterized protein (DUF2147 family)